MVDVDADVISLCLELEKEYREKNGDAYDRAPKYIELTDVDITRLRKKDMDEEGKIWSEPSYWYQYIRQHHPDALEQIYTDDKGVTRKRYLIPATTHEQKRNLWNRTDYKLERDLDESWDNPIFDTFEGGPRPELVEAGAMEDASTRAQRSKAMNFDPFQKNSRESDVFQQVAQETTQAHGQLSREGLRYSPSREAHLEKQKSMESIERQEFELDKSETAIRLHLGASDLESEEQLNKLKGKYVMLCQVRSCHVSNNYVTCHPPVR